MSALNKVPTFKWDATFATSVAVGYPLDNVSCYPDQRDGTEQAQAPSGTEDAWYVGTDHYMEADVRWVPEAATTNPVADGFSNTAKWESLFAWARQRGLVRYVPDVNVPATFLDGYLIDIQTSVESDATLRYHLKFRAASSYAALRASV